MTRTLPALLPLLALAQLGACKAWITEKEAEHYADVDGDGVAWDVDCDDDDPDVGGASDWYLDADGDGWGDTDAVVQSCGQPAGAVALRGDCDDADDGVYPGAPEDPYDDIDQDCDESDLNDVDGDGFAGKEAGGPDCNDEDDTIYPGAPDGYYDDIDQDCDGDPGTDQDGDGEASESVGGDDCNDDDGNVRPGATETWYDGVDQDCDGADDFDQDGDGEAAEGWGDDCDDQDDQINPSAEEICSDGVDNNCDGLATCGLEGYSDVLSADGMRYGAAKGDRAGHSIGALGDFDRDDDGLADLAVGARYSDIAASNAGAVYIVSGPISGTDSLASATAVLTGLSASDEAGYAVDGAGDLDVDGALDLIVGAPKRDSGDTDAGAAYLVLGPVSGTVALDDADTHNIAGEDDYDYAGQAVAGVGDLDRDGAGDVAIGAPGVDSQMGAVYIVHELRSGDFLINFAEGVWKGESAGDGAGCSVDGAGDMNADGYDDVVAGASYYDGAGEDRGAAYVIFGPGAEKTTLADADARLLGESDDDLLGTTVAAAGDVDGDGYGDVLLGAPGEDTAGAGAGATYLVLGPVSGDFNLFYAEARLYGEVSDDQSGGAIASGDLNFDGQSDIVIGASHGSSDTVADFGYTYILYGPISGDLSLASADARYAGTASSLYSGSEVLVPGDTDGDGVDDLVIGGWGYAPTSADTNSGGLWLFHGGGF